MDSPLVQEAPADMLNRVHEFARDLAYGAAQGLWSSQIDWSELGLLGVIGGMYEPIRVKWAMNTPPRALMYSFGYIVDYTQDSGLLTEKAFSLLDKPTAPPDVFISYRRSDSSALALLVEARLKLAGNPNPFVDKNLTAGTEWREHLRERVFNSRYFICLIGKGTLDSAQVQQEIEWATEAGCSIISLWHGREINEDAPPTLTQRHAIMVKEESALGYEVAINQLLNSLGYSTY